MGLPLLPAPQAGSRPPSHPGGLTLREAERQLAEEPRDATATQTGEEQDTSPIAFVQVTANSIVLIRIDEHAETQLAARAAPGTASEHNQAVGELSVMCNSSRTLPTPKKFEQALGVARRNLDPAYADAGNLTRRRDLERAAWALNGAEEEAAEVGLLPQ
ncbi:MAG TPA: hypothetical protein VGC05_10530 [Mycobacterium sp.]